MSATDFTAWVDMMKATRKWSDLECSRQLECGENQIRVWKAKGCRRSIALACAALSYGLPPWRDPKGL